MKTRYKIIILIVAIPVGLFASVFFAATIMSLTNTGYYYTPTEEELPTKTMIEQANALAVTQVFREKYPDSEPHAERWSSFGVHYQAYPDPDGPRDPNFDYEARNPYVALVVPFTDDKVVGKPYIYCVQNYVRSDRIYEEDYSRFYKVQSHEDIINHLQNESCFLTKEMELIQLYQDKPEVIAFYAKYDDASVSARDNHISYFAGSEDDSHVRMNMFFDKNYELDHIDFHCYFQREHQFELAQENIATALEKYDCKKRSEPVMYDVNSFKVQVTVRNATIHEISHRVEYDSIIVNLESLGDGFIILDIPRKLIDASSVDGGDASFIVLLEGEEILSEEISTNSEIRTIKIPFEKGATQIEIIGADEV